MAAALAALAVTPLAASPAAGAQTCARAFATPTAERDLVGLINGQRAQAGLRPLAVHRTLKGVARRHSRAMATGGWFAHAGQFRWARGRAAGENLAQAPTPQLALEAMLRSPTHLRNMMDPTWRFIGIGATTDCAGGTMYTVELMAGR